MLGTTAAALTLNVHRAGLGMAAARAMSALLTPRSMRNLWSAVASGKARASDAVVQATSDPSRSSVPSASEDSGPRAADQPHDGEHGGGGEVQHAVGAEPRVAGAVAGQRPRR